MTKNTDRETLEKVAAGYNDLMALYAQQRQTQAKMIRACLVRLRSTSARDRREALDGLANLADMLDPEKI